MYACFRFTKKWLKGEIVVLTKENFGCGGASNHLFRHPKRSHKDFINFRTKDEELKANHDLMEDWVSHTKLYQPENDYSIYGPLKMLVR
ncbi:MAG TPA: hypothetical protein DCG75_17005 [Bacteroidales bacterium]|nr:hypothetical protein [Bacteroidales bacterium]